MYPEHEAILRKVKALIAELPQPQRQSLEKRLDKILHETYPEHITIKLLDLLDELSKNEG